ncbi:MAG TPA: FKBP-type peptidyl-prolyl cis-trans isomerase [Steroidobacteraceae bacterium]|nr:FKBP-type peptidyl-prolyl cis-trans isomerase [Steroidobacteraceae bacterium]
MTARIPVAIAAVLAAGSLAITAAGAQDSDTQESGTQTHSTHAHAHATPGAGATSSEAGDKADASYSLGLLIGAQLPKLGLDDKTVDFQKFSQGLKDVMSGKAKPGQPDQQKVANFVQQTNAASARRFLAANSKRPGVKTTQSGLQYKVLNEGSGAPPHPTDQVTVNYRGTLLDGTVFDSSYEKGKPFTFPLSQRMIPGWTEAISMMKPGAKWEIYIPPELAYGANSPAPQIPPNALLKFDVELLKVEPASPAPGALPGGAGPNVGSPTGR